MGLKEVKQEILDKASKEADELIAQANKESEEVMKEAESKVQDYKTNAEQSTARTLETMEKREIAQAEFDVRKALLDKKKDVINQVMEDVREEIANLPEKKRTEYIKKLIDKAKTEIEVSLVEANSKDKKAVESVKGVRFKSAQMLGGVIARTQDERISVDYSYEELLQNIQESSLQEIGKILFK